MSSTSLSRARLRARSFAIALAAFLALAPAAHAQAVFENPTAGSPQSGIGMFSGWLCDAGTVTIEVDGKHVVQAAYGTPRSDTESICGDKNNGFGVLFNFNLLGDGAHTAVAKADGIAFGTHTFTVTKPTDAPFATGLAASYRVPFPPGKVMSLVWQQGTQSFAIAPESESASSAASGAATAATTLGTFENPGPGTFVSGVIVFSGWLCDAQTVEIVIDDTTRVTPAYGTSRSDTQAICGDTNNGFGVLFNANLLQSGTHTAVLLVDGAPFASTTFAVTVPTDQPFVPDLSGTFRLPGFPDPSSDVVVEWQTGLQNFVIASKQPTAGPTPTFAPTGTPGPTSTPGPSSTPWSTSTPDPTATPPPVATSTPVPTASPTPIPSPQPTATPSPTPTPSGPFCGNGIVDGDDEECDGQDGLEDVTCESLYSYSYECTGSVTCTSDCRYDGRACDCPCGEDFDCELPSTIDCTPQYCSLECSDPEDAAGCECIVDYGSCVNGSCVTTPFDPANLEEFCLGFQDDDPDYPRCDSCFE